MSNYSNEAQISYGLIDIPSPYQRQRDLAEWRRFLHDTGYTFGIELTPGKTYCSKLQRDIGRRAMHGVLNDGVITSLHQTWRDDTVRSATQDIIRYPAQNPIQRVARRGVILATMPRHLDSLDHMARLQSQISPQTPLPVVLYPTIDHGQVDFKLEHRFAEKLFQPTAEVWDKWQVDSVEAMKQTMLQRGLGGCVLDLVHIRRQFMQQVNCRELPPWDSFICDVARNGLLSAIHVGAGRTDVATPAADPTLWQVTKDEMTYLARPDAQLFASSEMAAMLQLAIAEYRTATGQPQATPRIVTEFPAFVYSELGLSELVVHGRAVENIKSVVAAM